MQNIKRTFFDLFLTLALSSCFAEKNKTSVQETSEKSASLAFENKIVPVQATPQQLFRKDQREAIYFSASLEKEALKILTKNPSFDELTLFSVLSYALETSYGVKKSPPSHLDCSRFRFVKQTEGSASKPTKVVVFKTCQKPESKIAEIEISKDQANLSIAFLSKEWIPVLGLSATLYGENVRCELEIEKKKLASLRCQNWIRTLGVTNTSAEELRLNTFVFDRKNSHQFVLKGGLYRDLVERKKVEIDVPLEGKIKRFEKEIEVIDQYAEEAAEPEKPRTVQPEVERMQIKPVDSSNDVAPTEINGGVPPSSRRQGR